jgi:hypothetical protein
VLCLVLRLNISKDVRNSSRSVISKFLFRYYPFSRGTHDDVLLNSGCETWL